MRLPAVLHREDSGSVRNRRAEKNTRNVAVPRQPRLLALGVLVDLCATRSADLTARWHVGWLHATLPTRQNALALELDARTYGTFAEIDGVQEVARSFFAGTGSPTRFAHSPAPDEAVELVAVA